MLGTLRAELRKLLTVRSTYFVTGFAILLMAFIAFYGEGWRLSGGSLSDPTQLAGDVLGALNLAVFGAVVAVLLVTHEYRYNTIVYTLTNSNSRSKVLFSKLIAASVYALILSAIIGTLSPVMAYLGVHAHGHTLGPQTLHYWNLIWRSLFYGWGYAMAGFLLALLTRNQIASVVSLFVIPDLVEQLLRIILKQNVAYLPFTALNQVIRMGGSMDPYSSTLSPLKSAGVYCVYLALGWIVAWALFLRRDAN
ncbi:MAG TPA: ABC transporter permease subunit [Candidatus Saccharimonadales bacterium]|nr:ABC transporter permease subunit [Candidatus Saccharimonadales bacterium]